MPMDLYDDAENGRLFPTEKLGVTSDNQSEKNTFFHISHL